MMRSFIEKVLYGLLIDILVSLVVFYPFMLFVGVLHSREPSISTMGWRDSLALVFVLSLVDDVLSLSWRKLLRKK